MNHTKIMESLTWRKIHLGTSIPKPDIEVKPKRNLRDEARGVIQFCGQLQSKYHDCMSEQIQSLYTIANHEGEDLTRDIYLKLPRGMKNSRAIRQLLIAATLIDHPFLSLLRNEALELAQNKQYRGGWMQVQHLVELSYSRSQLLYLLLQESSGRALLGWLPEIVSQLCCNTSYRSNVQKGPVKRPNQIGVGYRDKGTRTPDHEKIVEQYHTGSNPENLDFSALAYKRNSIMNFLTARSTKLIPQNNKIKKRGNNQ